MSASKTPSLILASTSKYRAALLAKLGLEFRLEAPRIDEDSLKRPDLDPRALAEYLARAKAESVGELFPDAVVIGGDQLLGLDGEVIGKPRDPEDAFRQLRCLSGRRFELVTAIGLAHRGRWTPATQITTFHVRDLSDGQIRRYLERDRPYDCAGSFRLEDHGLTLFKSVEGNDPLASMGIPLTALIALLEPLGYVTP